MSAVPSRDQWIERFVERLAAIGDHHDEARLRAVAAGRWAQDGHLAPDVAAEAAHRGMAGTATAAADDADRFERTERIPVERITASGDYVRDDDTWVARCVTRVLELDPIIRREEAERSVGDLATLERWRTMRPEAAAEQLYTPIRPRTD